MAHVEDYLDKEHAVGILWCLEKHFSHITDQLDFAGVPNADADEVHLTVLQRVNLLRQAFETAVQNKDDRKSILAALYPIKEPQEMDAEDINILITAKRDIPPIWERLTNKEKENE